MTDDAIQFIRDRPPEKPFFLYLPYTCPHAPFQGPNDQLTDPLPLDSLLWKQGIAPPEVYVSMIEHMDKRIGDLLSTLKQQGLEKNTVVVFCSDNGGTRSARNEPLSGFKGSTYEGGIRVPAMVRWPGVVPAGKTCDQPCITFDFTRSFAELGGVQVDPNKPLEGIDIIGHVADVEPGFQRILFWRKQRGTTVWKAVRDGTLKYVSQENNGVESEHLFDLADDISEKQDLRNQYTDQFNRLQESYRQWEKDVRKNRRGRPPISHEVNP